MSLSTAKRLAIKKHLGQHPIDTVLDPLITALEDAGAKESELSAAVDDCDAALDSIATAQDEADELIEGGGAKFNYNTRISIKQRAYHRTVCNLARIIGWPMPETGQVTGFFAL